MINAANFSKINEKQRQKCKKDLILRVFFVDVN